MDEPVLQKIAIPIEDADSFVSEGAWGQQVAGDSYRVDNILGFTSGVSNGDVVRVDVLPDGRLVAVEVLERFDGPTYVFSPAGDIDRKDLWELLRAMVDDAPRRSLAVEGLMDGLVAVQYRSLAEPWFWDELVARLGELTGATIRPDHDEQQVGPVGYWLVTHPSWDVPAPLDTTRVRADAHAPDLVAVDWPRSDDAVAAAWPAELVDELRARATADPRLRALLDHRLYLQLATLELRMTMRDEHGPERAGRQRWPLGTAPDDEEGRAAWLAQRDADGRVRFAPDDEVDAAMREHLRALGLDPDADPYLPSTNPVE